MHRIVYEVKIKGNFRLACELSSTRNGFPFGLYRYIDSTRDKEIWISNVPFWDSLSFSFLCYLGFFMALIINCPLSGKGLSVRVEETIKARRSFRVLLTGAFFTALLDIIIDPVTLLGDRWFLGKIYEYAVPGAYYGIPISNFLGWGFVAFVTIGIFQLLDRVLPLKDTLPQPLALPGIVLYFGVFAFNLAVTFSIGETQLGLVGLFISLPVAVFLESAVSFKLKANIKEKE